jgi:hypothetical protein
MPRVGFEPKILSVRAGEDILCLKQYDDCQRVSKDSDILAAAQLGGARMALV